MSQDRILHIGSGKLYGGIETALVTMAKYRASCPRLEQDFALCFSGRLERELFSAGAKTFLLPEVRVRQPWTVMTARRKLRELIDQNGYRAVICHATWPMAIFGPAVHDSRLLYWTHDAVEGKHWLEKWARRIRPHMVICNAEFTAQKVCSIYPDVPKSVIRCPVEFHFQDSSPRQRVRETLGVASESVVIIQVSRMEHWKGQTLHLSALAKLKDLPGWECWFVGGAQREQERQYVDGLQKQAQDSEISNRVRFLGQRNDVRDLLAAADIFCQPNIGPEPFGIVFIEALAARLPVIATAMGGALEIVTPDCGFLTPPEDPAALANTLKQLIQDADLRRRLGENGPNRAIELCSPEPRIAELEHLLRSNGVLSSHS